MFRRLPPYSGIRLSISVTRAPRGSRTAPTRIGPSIVGPLSRISKLSCVPVWLPGVQLPAPEMLMIAVGGRAEPSTETAIVLFALTATAALLAEREFHRFYIRGLCCRALDQGVSALVIYRARPATQGRPSSDAMVGVRITVSSLLEDLRVTFRGVPPHGLPQCHDPGLSVRLP